MKYKIVKRYCPILGMVDYRVYEKSFIYWNYVDYRSNELAALKLIELLKDMRK